VHDAHDVPQANCTCGIYAVKTLDHFRSAGYERFGICGEVFLWGKVVEHELGYRAQLAYPKNLFLSLDALPFTLAEIRSRLEMLTTYRIDIFVADPKGNIPLWAKESGCSPVGLDYLIERSKQDHDRRQQERTLKKGDRVAILGRGIAVVEQIDDTEVHSLLRNRIMLRMRRDDIVWNQQNVRWETNPSSVSQTKPKAISFARNTD
jgi:preprotein translocase subunit YajC